MEDTHHAVESFILGGVVLLGAALIFVLLFRRLGLGAVLGYLVGGIVIGPQGLALVGNADTIMGFSEIGIVLLLFLVGLELSPRRLWQMRTDIFGLGAAQVILCGLAMFAVLLVVTPGFSWAAALVLALPLGLSSTAQVLPLLQSGGRMRTAYGEKSFSILLFQDVSIVPLLTIVAVLSRGPVDADKPQGWLLAFYAGIAIVGLVLAGHYILSPLLRLVGKVSERELFIVAGLFAVAASAALMQAIGLSAALGAFVAGVMLAESPYRHELEADIDPFRSLLLGIFFMSVGMALDLEVVVQNPVLVLGLAAILVGVKTAIIFALARLFGLKNKDSLIMALLLSQGGEFAFVLFGAAQTALLIEPAAASLFGAVVTLSMATTPFLMLFAGRLAKDGGGAKAELVDPEDADNASVIIVGHGRFGQTAAQICQAAGLSVTLIDIQPEAIDRSAEFGCKVYFGDGTRIDLLRRAGAAEASAILFCHDDRAFDAAKAAVIAETFADARLFVRARDRTQSLSLQEAQGVTIVREVLESAVALSGSALRAVGFDEGRTAAIIAEYRRRDLARMAEQRKAGDMHAGSHLSFGAPDSEAFAADSSDLPPAAVKPG